MSIAIAGGTKAGAIGTPTLFDTKEGKGPARHLKLVSFEKRKGDLLWLRYKLKR